MRRLPLFAAASAVAMLPVPGLAAPAPRAWWGTYAYEWSGGRTVGGSPIIVNYRLTLGAKRCRITAQGWLTDEVLLCDAVPGGGVLNITFVSYGDGEVRNQYGVLRYKPGERLFSLSNKGETIWTGWGSYAPWEKERPLGKHFRKVA